MPRVALSLPQRKVLSKAVASLLLAIDTGDYELIWDVCEVIGDMLVSMGASQRRKKRVDRLRGSLTAKAFRDINKAIERGNRG